MKLVVIVLASFFCVLAALTESEWKVYKERYGKAYGQREDFLRRTIFQDNFLTIKTHNEKYARGERSFFMGINQFADMTTSEFSKTMNGLRINKQPKTVQTKINTPINSELPVTVNWVKKGYVTGVKNQGHCGSCWAFSVTGSLEGQHFNKTGNLVSLSESNLIDCSGEYGNHGCSGGYMSSAFDYIIKNKGINTEASYPYIPEEMTCKFNKTDIGATMRSYKHVLPRGSENALQESVANIGPISISIDAGQRSFAHYSGGVYDEPNCKKDRLNHAMLVVGYGTHEGKDYWLVKNSWGTSWGMDGYIMMSRNKNNQCGIATECSYPVV